MPIYRQTYRHFDGEVRRHFRWMIVVKQELRVLLGMKLFMLLLLGALLHFLLRLLQVVAYDVVVQDPNNPLSAMLKQVTMLVVDKDMMRAFVQFQTPLVFLMMLYIGAGMISNDFSNNLMEVYFSKPITWLDYALGKVLTLLFVGLSITAVPSVILVLVHNLLLPGMETIQTSWWWIFAAIGYSLIIVLPTALGILASSSLLQSQNYAAIAVFLVIVANSSMGLLLSQLLYDRDYALVAFPYTIETIGEYLFGIRRQHQASLPIALSYVAFVCLASLWIIFRRVRRAEVAA